MDGNVIEQFILSAANPNSEITLPFGKDVSFYNNTEMAVISATFHKDELVTVFGTDAGAEYQNNILLMHESTDTGKMIALPSGSYTPKMFLEMVTNYLNASVDTLGFEWRAILSDYGHAQLFYSQTVSKTPTFTETANIVLSNNGEDLEITATNGVEEVARAYGYICRGHGSFTCTVDPISFVITNPDAVIVIGLYSTLTQQITHGVRITTGGDYVAFAPGGVTATLTLGTFPKLTFDVKDNTFTIFDDVAPTTAIFQSEIDAEVIRTMQVAVLDAVVDLTGLEWFISPFIYDTMVGMDVQVGVQNPNLDVNVDGLHYEDVSVVFDSIPARQLFGFFEQPASLSQRSGGFVGSHPLMYFNTTPSISLTLRNLGLRVNSNKNLIVAMPVPSSAGHVSYQSPMHQWLQFRCSIPIKTSDLVLESKDHRGRPVTLRNFTITIQVKTPREPGHQGPLASQYAAIARAGGQTLAEDRDETFLRALRAIAESIPRSIQDAFSGKAGLPTALPHVTPNDFGRGLLVGGQGDEQIERSELANVGHRHRRAPSASTASSVLQSNFIGNHKMNTPPIVSRTSSGLYAGNRRY